MHCTQRLNVESGALSCQCLCLRVLMELYISYLKTTLVNLNYNNDKAIDRTLF